MTCELSLPPGVVIVTGPIGAGKTTVMCKVAETIPNSVHLQKDTINRALLFRRSIWLSGRPEAQTFLGEMDEHSPIGDFYDENVRDPSYLSMAFQARDSLEEGKLVIFDTIPYRMICSGEMEGLIKYFQPYPSYVLRFVVDEEEGFRRLTERATIDPYKRLKDGEKTSSREAYHRYLTKEEPWYPEELKVYPHRLINTTAQSVQESVRESLDYIRWFLAG